mmetsp:Transcript_16221/g.29660  ORF Transcript_16221/g.29660 Transcript_16221/m.29660 type:complete len:814 (+) Transcript_16221:851-3292(+)
MEEVASLGGERKVLRECELVKGALAAALASAQPGSPVDVESVDCQSPIMEEVTENIPDHEVSEESALVRSMSGNSSDETPNKSLNKPSIKILPASDPTPESSPKPTETTSKDDVTIKGTVSIVEGQFSLQGSWYFQGSDMGKFVHTSSFEDVQPMQQLDEHNLATSQTSSSNEKEEAKTQTLTPTPTPTSIATLSPAPHLETCQGILGSTNLEPVEIKTGLSASIRTGQVRRWSGNFTMLNPAYETKRKKKRSTRKHLTIVESFDWHLEPNSARTTETKETSVVAISALGRNRFGKFSLDGTLNIGTGAFSAVKLYLAPKQAGSGPVNDSVSDDDATVSRASDKSHETKVKSRKSGRAFVYSDDVKGTRCSKRQRTPNRVLKLDASKQSYAFIARHGNGSALKSTARANKSAGASKAQRASSKAGEPHQVGCECSKCTLLDPSLRKDPTVKSAPNMQDIQLVIQQPVDKEKAAHVRKVAKRKTCALVRQFLRNPASIRDFKRSPSTLSRYGSTGSVSMGHDHLSGKKSRDMGSSKGIGRGRSRSKVGSLVHGSRTSAEEQESEQGIKLSSQLYEGGLVDGVRHGIGICVFEDGRVYEGEWRWGQMDGKGRLFNSKMQLIYQGEFSDGHMNGKGTLLCSNGDRFDGDFRDNLFHGFGIHFEVASGSTYRGNWVRGKRSGHGDITLRDGSHYSGEWHNGVWSGRGVLMVKNKCSYEGSFKNGQFEGRGICTYPGKGSFEGTFRLGLKEGRGTYTFPNGAVYEGRFRNDKHEGFGVLKMTKEDSIKVGEDDWIIPVNLPSGLRFVHRAAGFNDDGN